MSVNARDSGENAQMQASVELESPKKRSVPKLHLALTHNGKLSNTVNFEELFGSDLPFCTDRLSTLEQTKGPPTQSNGNEKIFKNLKSKFKGMMKGFGKEKTLSSARSASF